MAYRFLRPLLPSLPFAWACACLAVTAMAAYASPAGVAPGNAAPANAAPKTASPAPAPGQGAAPPGLAGKAPLDPVLVARADSMRRAIERRTYSDADKKEIRACDREKSDFLKRARTADPEYGQVDQALLKARIAGGAPDDPAILALMERKFAFEKAFDDRYLATSRGKVCAAGAARRSKAVNAALEKDKAYQDLLKRIAASSADHL